MASTTPTATSYPAWETAFLTQIQAPSNAVTLEALNLWAAAEGGVPSNNPLNASGKGPGATTCIAQCGSSSPIYAYATLDQGVAYNTQFLQRQGNGYPAIISAFQEGTSLSAIWQAINQSGWCHGCGGGKYPGALYAALNGGAVSVYTAAGANSPSAENPGASGVGCSGGGFDILGAHIMTNCQRKALVGGLLVGAGGLVLLVGATLIASNALKGTALKAADPLQRIPGVRRGAEATQAVATAPAEVATPATAPAPAPETTPEDEETKRENRRLAAQLRARQTPRQHTRTPRQTREHMDADRKARTGDNGRYAPF